MLNFPWICRVCVCCRGSDIYSFCIPLRTSCIVDCFGTVQVFFVVIVLVVSETFMEYAFI